MDVNKISNYYTNKIIKNKNSSLGVDWKNRKSQYLRFLYLSKVIKKNNFSLIDFGCGDGEIVKYLNKNKIKVKSYYGYDISEEMIKVAKKKYISNNIKFFNTAKFKKKSDYIISSGLFNVKLSNPNKSWLKYILKNIDKMDKYSKKGFAFNILSAFSHPKKRSDRLYYADPAKLFNYVKQINNNVTLYHDYHLYEFTIVVNK